MKTILNTQHHLHQPKGELDGGVFVPPYEKPQRVEYIMDALEQQKFDATIPAGKADMELIRAVHDLDYITFLETAFSEWEADGQAGEVIANIFPSRSTHLNRPPKDIVGKVGYYTLAIETSITKTTWDAALGSAATAQDASQLVANGEDCAFALCRPPGHHASKNQFGGYCFINNAAVAAETLQRSGAARVAILDVDFHHGNGTQAIYYDREDVFFASLHGHPEDEFPYYLGYADEIGAGPGEGSNLNLPFRPGTSYAVWAEGLDQAKDKIAAFGADALVVSLGVDTFKNDPISSFKLESEDFLDMGKRLAGLKLPTVFVMEGGYAVEEIGTNTVNCLMGFENH